jgi:hypothetical protein
MSVTCRETQKMQAWIEKMRYIGVSTKMSDLTHMDIFNASLAPGVYEVGGGYGQKGVDFQRYWAISRIIELVDSNEPDFLILFESLQDIVEFDCADSPTMARVYQLKAKGIGEWSWKALTALPAEPRKKKNSTEKTTPMPFVESPIGKLASTLAELNTFQCEGIFVSNLGCKAEMENGSFAGSIRICKFSELSKQLRDQIAPELQKLKRPVPMESLHLHKTDLSVEDPDTHVLGKVNSYLMKVAPKHVGQSKSFADSLFALLSKRGRKTDPPSNFAELVSTRGYSRTQFMSAVDDLRSIPNQQEVVDSWLHYLMIGGMLPLDHTRLQVKLTQILEKRLQTGTDERTPLEEAAKQFAKDNPPGSNIREYVESGAFILLLQFPGTRLDELQATVLLEGISQCLSQT